MNQKRIQILKLIKIKDFKEVRKFLKNFKNGHSPCVRWNNYLTDQSFKKLLSLSKDDCELRSEKCKICKVIFTKMDKGSCPCFDHSEKLVISVIKKIIKRYKSLKF
jgi:hypothetical protein